jgi:tRNA A37 N6-isopentenylltransferase MiaA
MIDIIEPSREYSVQEFKKESEEIMDKIYEK